MFQVMNESARIARGPVRPLSQLTAADAEAVVIPGGFGAAKNLSDFGFKGERKVGHQKWFKMFFNKEFCNTGSPLLTRFSK